MNDFRSFRILIGQPKEFPLMKQNSLLIEPGREHYISLSSQVISASRIEEIHPESRNCFFSHEGNLEIYEEYTARNCKFECDLKTTFQKYNCTPWFLPPISNSTMCSPWTEKDFMNDFGTLDSADSKCRICLPDCEVNQTNVVATSAKFR